LPTTTPAPNSNDSPTPAPQGGEAEGGGMSYWVATGIGLGAGIGLAALMGLGFMCWCRRIDRQHEKSSEALERYLEARRAEYFYRRYPSSRSEQEGGTPSASSPPLGQPEGGQGASGRQSASGGQWFRDPLVAPMLESELESTLNAAWRHAAEGDAAGRGAAVGNSAAGNLAQKGLATGTGDAS
jgi:hypothetical protein